MSEHSGIRRGARIAIHGGAGVIRRDSFGQDREQRYLATLEQIVQAAYERLLAGAQALDAAQFAVTLLEDCEFFNAGRGAVLNRDGDPEFDAALMRGSDRAAGAIAAARESRNPILAARAVLEHSEHVLLAGPGADAFARDNGVPVAGRDWFVVPERERQLRNAQRSGRVSLDHDEQYRVDQGIDGQGSDANSGSDSPDNGLGTVGAVVRDIRGGLAAATSTGGMTNKLPGRVGDTPLVGSGTWADDQTCAVSGTGHGEFMIRSQTAYDVHARMQYQGLDLVQACDRALETFRLAGGSGGLIAVSAAGEIYLPFISPGMYRAWVAEDGQARAAIFPL